MVSEMLIVMLCQERVWRMGREERENIEWGYGSAIIVSEKGLTSCSDWKHEHCPASFASLDAYETAGSLELLSKPQANHVRSRTVVAYRTRSTARCRRKGLRPMSSQNNIRERVLLAEKTHVQASGSHYPEWGCCLLGFATASTLSRSLLEVE